MVPWFVTIVRDVRELLVHRPVPFVAPIGELPRDLCCFREIVDGENVVLLCCAVLVLAALPFLEKVVDLPAPKDERVVAIPPPWRGAPVGVVASTDEVRVIVHDILDRSETLLT